MTDGRRYANKPADQRRAERHQRLLDAGLDLFGTGGYADTTIQELCRVARVSVRTFYEEFGRREDLLIELHDLLNARAHRAVVETIAELPLADLARRATAGMRAYFDVMTTDPRWARIALVESVGVDAQVDAHRRAAIDRFAQLLQGELEATAAAGVIEPRDFSLTVIGLVGAINELVMTWTTRPDWDAVVDEVVAEGVRFVVAAQVPVDVDVPR